MIIVRPPIILFPNRFHSSGFCDKKQGFARDQLWNSKSTLPCALY